jgi:ParB-like chromosome segregation protein Spo0J
MAKKTPAIKAKSALLWVRLDQLAYLRRNPQYLSPHAMEALKMSIQRDGFLAPILVRKRGTKYELLSGNHRAMAAHELGMKEVPAIVSALNDRQAKRVAVNLNTVHGEPNAELLAPFLAELDEELLASVHLDDETIRAVSELDADLAASLSKLEAPEGFNRESPTSEIAQCACPTCGKRHIRSSAGKRDGVQKGEDAAEQGKAPDVRGKRASAAPSDTGRAAVRASGRPGRGGSSDQHPHGKSDGAVRDPGSSPTWFGKRVSEVSKSQLRPRG